VGRLKTQCLISENTDVNQVQDKESALFRDFTQRRMAAQKRLYGTAIPHCFKSQRVPEIAHGREKFFPQCDKYFSRGGGI